MRFLAAVAVAVAAFVWVAPSPGVYQKPGIARIASIFAERPVRARCYGKIEVGSPYQENAWGYVYRPGPKASYMHLDGDLCRAALAVNDTSIPPFWRAVGVLTIVHEAYHMRRWGAWGNEAKVECQAIRHFKVGARLFGATEQTVNELWPWALADHYYTASIHDIWGNRPYDDPDCNTPPLYDYEEEQGD